MEDRPTLSEDSVSPELNTLQIHRHANYYFQVAIFKVSIIVFVPVVLA
jgi:hypothetical protein